MSDKFVFRYDRHTKKGIIKTGKDEIKINLEKKQVTQSSVSSSGSGANGYGLHLI